MSNDDITKQLPEILSRVLAQMDAIISRVVTVEQSVNSGFTELGNRMEALETWE